MVVSFRRISHHNTALLQQFLDHAGDALLTFRYFSSRPLSIVSNHIATVLLMEEETPVGYGHLDQEAGIVWLGIALLPSVQGKGYGTKMMRYLIDIAAAEGVAEIRLSVDKVNTGAVALYQKMGFQVMDTGHPNIYMMKLKLDAEK